ncbi:zinc finger protein 648-like [Thrips palmi]|uniref:Zinc finger protein 648-like n=1 Tax=Thrips palmi TaxID=161013 RepID=A0A6P8ZB07_THRPL|nr:zinc finger protein 648-like [Thrips palmi]
MFACDDCERQFAHARSLQRHRRVDHHAPAHRCEQCKRAYRYGWQKQQYLRSAHELSGSHRYPCSAPGCIYRSTTRSNLTRHWRTCHSAIAKELADGYTSQPAHRPTKPDNQTDDPRKEAVREALKTFLTNAIAAAITLARSEARPVTVDDIRAAL